MIEDEGKANIHILAEHFTVNKNTLKLDFSGIRSLLTRSYSKPTFRQLIKCLITHHGMDFPPVYAAVLAGLMSLSVIWCLNKVSGFRSRPK